VIACNPPDRETGSYVTRNESCSGNSLPECGMVDAIEPELPLVFEGYASFASRCLKVPLDCPLAWVSAMDRK